MALDAGLLVQTTSLRLFFGRARERSKSRGLLGKIRAILRRVTLIGRRFLIDLGEASVLVGR